MSRWPDLPAGVDVAAIARANMIEPPCRCFVCRADRAVRRGGPLLVWGGMFAVAAWLGLFLSRALMATPAYGDAIDDERRAVRQAAVATAQAGRPPAPAMPTPGAPR